LGREGRVVTTARMMSRFAAVPTLHTLEPDRRTLHGSFSRDRPPVLTVDPGDTVRFRTLDSGWGLESHAPGSLERRAFEGRVSPDDDGHALVGPVAVRGARPGMTLEVQIGEIVPGEYGACLAGGWPSAWNEELGVTSHGVIHVYALDREAGVARSAEAGELPLSPFMGVMGMPPDLPGVHSTIPPRACGGNLDCKELVAGSTLYLPVEVEGGLFSVGDGHAAQGDGEVSGTAIECPIDRVDLTFRLRDDMPLAAPVADTPIGWLTFGLDADLDRAAVAALEAMVRLISARRGVSRLDALAIASLSVDLRITQMVNEVRGVHAVLRSATT
jgi:acetamidase/formamidase